MLKPPPRRWPAWTLWITIILTLVSLIGVVEVHHGGGASILMGWGRVMAASGPVGSTTSHVVAGFGPLRLGVGIAGSLDGRDRPALSQRAGWLFSTPTVRSTEFAPHTDVIRQVSIPMWLFVLLAALVRWRACRHKSAVTGSENARNHAVAPAGR